MSTSPPDHESDQIEPERNPHRLRKVVIIFAVVLVVAIVATLASGPLKSSSSSSSSDPTAASTTTANNASTEGCTTGPASADVRVTIYGNGEAACSKYN